MTEDTELNVLLPLSLLFNFLMAIGMMALGLWCYNALHFIDFYQKELTYYKQSYNYLSNGVVDRGLMEICVNKNEEEGVWFREDCK